MGVSYERGTPVGRVGALLAVEPCADHGVYLRVLGFGFGVWGLGYGVWGSAFSVQCCCFWLQVLGVGLQGRGLRGCG